MAEREFIGEKGLGFLNSEDLRYYIRIRLNFKVFLPHKNHTIKAFHLFNSFKVNEFVYYPKIVRINGQLCYLSGCKRGIKNGEQDFLILVSSKFSEKA